MFLTLKNSMMQTHVSSRKLAGMLSLTESEVSMKEAAQLDYFVAAY